MNPLARTRKNLTLITGAFLLVSVLLWLAAPDLAFFFPLWVIGFSSSLFLLALLLIFTMKTHK